MTLSEALPYESLACTATKTRPAHCYSSFQLLRNTLGGPARTPGSGVRAPVGESGALDVVGSGPAVHGPRGLGHVTPCLSGFRSLVSKCENRPDGLRSL